MATPPADSPAARELAAVLKTRVDDLDQRLQDLRVDVADVKAEARKLSDIVADLRLVLAEARGQRAAALDWRGVAFSSVGAVAGLAAAAKAFGLLG
jgi:hypothetical protein